MLIFKCPSCDMQFDVRFDPDQGHRIIKYCPFCGDDFSKNDYRPLCVESIELDHEYHEGGWG